MLQILDFILKCDMAHLDIFTALCHIAMFPSKLNLCTKLFKETGDRRNKTHTQKHVIDNSNHVIHNPHKGKHCMKMIMKGIGRNPSSFVHYHSKHTSESKLKLCLLVKWQNHGELFFRLGRNSIKGTYRIEMKNS